MSEKVPVTDQRTRPGHGMILRRNGAPTVVMDDPNELTADDWYELNEKWLPSHKVVVDRARFERLLIASRFAKGIWAIRDWTEIAALKPSDLDPLP